MKKNKHAYLIIAHNEFDLLQKLLVSLDYEYNDLYVHIDKKSKFEDYKYLTENLKKSKVNIFSKYSVKWGDKSQVDCEMFLIKKCINFADYSYIHLLSGADLPLKNNEYIYSFYEKNQGKEFVHFDSKNVSNDSKERVCYYHFFSKCYKFSKNRYLNKVVFLIDQLIVKIQKIAHFKKKIHFKNIQKGCNWFSITGGFAKYLVSMEPYINKMCRYSKCADEVFLQTVLINSKYKFNLYYNKFDDNYEACQRYILWDNPKTPHTFNKNDIDLLLNTKLLFARKFSMKKDKDIVEEVLKMREVI